MDGMNRAPFLETHRARRNNRRSTAERTGPGTRLTGRFPDNTGEIQGIYRDCVPAVRHETGHWFPGVHSSSRRGGFVVNNNESASRMSLQGPASMQGRGPAGLQTEGPPEAARAI